MKKITFLTLAIILSMAVNAQKAVLRTSNLRQNVNRQYVQTPMAANKLAEAKSHAKTVIELRTQNPTKKQINTRANEDTGIITEAPKGREVSYSKNTTAFYVTLGFALQEYRPAVIGNVIFCDDNTGYIRNPFSAAITNSYLKGLVDGDEITITLPQPIYYETGETDNNFVYQADRLILVDGYYHPDTENNEIKFKMRNDTLLWDEPTDGSVILGLTYDNQWMGYGDYSSTFIPMTDKKTEVPDELTTEDWTFSANGGSHTVGMAFDGDNVYMKGFYEALPDSWIKGQINGDTVTFNSGQYLGADETSGFQAYMMAAGSENVYDSIYRQEVGVYVFRDNIKFTYDMSAKKMYAESKNDSSMLVNAGKSTVYYIKRYDAPIIKQKTEITGAQKPATPQILYCDPYSEGLGFADIAFILPNTDVDGNELDTDKLHYNLFFDDDIATFTPDVYLGLKEEMTDIPYDFTDNWDFQIYMDGTVREILFYETDIEKVGVRSTYTSDEGESADSDIAWYYFTPTNISNIEPDNTDIKVVYYTDVAGRRISRPANGLYLKTEVYGNGTSKTTKVMIK